MTNEIRILDRAFAERGITAAYTRLEYTRELRGCGKATLIMPASSASALITPDGYIRVPDGTLYRVISTVTDREKDTVTVHCEGLLSLFRGTVIPEEYRYEGSVPAIMCGIVRGSIGRLPLPLRIADVPDGVVASISSGKSSLYDDLVTLCYLGGVGMKLEHDGEGHLLFTVTPTVDRTEHSADPILVSRGIGTLDAASLSLDLESYKNVAVVVGAENPAGGRYKATVRSTEVNLADSFPDEEYFDRETVVNFTAPTSQWTSETESGERVFDAAAYNTAMRAAGAAVLARLRPRLILRGKVVGNASLILPGDTVTVEAPELGLSAAATAMKMTAVYDTAGCSFTVELAGEAV